LSSIAVRSGASVDTGIDVQARHVRQRRRRIFFIA
jgi:hypothetical protein